MSTHNLSGSASFKFNLINTVRKAFRKDNSHLTHKDPKSGLTTKVVAAFPKESHSNDINESSSVSFYETRLRSKTFDSADSVVGAIAPPPLKQPPPSKAKTKFEIFQKKNDSTSKIGSMDSLNNADIINNVTVVASGRKAKNYINSKNFDFEKFNQNDNVNETNHSKHIVLTNSNNNNNESCISSTSSAMSSQPEYDQDSHEYEANPNTINENKENFNDLNLNILHNHHHHLVNHLHHPNNKSNNNRHSKMIDESNIPVANANDLYSNYSYKSSTP
jgi:hypothetical protein